MKTVIHLFHGWGCGADIWSSFVQEIHNKAAHSKITIFNYDRGYFSENDFIEPDSAIWNTKDNHIIVSHSMGCALVPVDLLTIASQWIMVSGFRSFHAIDEALTRKALTMMTQSFLKFPQKGLRRFLEKMMYPADIDLLTSVYTKKLFSMNESQLYKDLLVLDSCEITIGKVPNMLKLTIFHGKQDSIVSVKHAHYLAQMLNVENIIIENAGHGIPVTHPSLLLSALCFK
jgi:pimeloyl-ACP methyl ester carboxylesterase